MTINEIKKFYEKQIEWHKKQIECCSKDIKWYGDQLKHSRKKDRELAEWVIRNPNYSDEEKATYINYKSSETEKYEKIRRQRYVCRKRHAKEVAKCERMIAEL